MTEKEELMEVQQTFIEYANELIASTNERLGKINLGLEELGVEDENLYLKKFEDEDFETLDTILEKLDVNELELLTSLLGHASVSGMEQAMTDDQRELYINNIIDENYNLWLEELEENEDEE